jgi:hypothetical protein
MSLTVSALRLALRDLDGGTPVAIEVFTGERYAFCAAALPAWRPLRESQAGQHEHVFCLVSAEGPPAGGTVAVSEADLRRMLAELAHLRGQRDQLQASNTRLLEILRAAAVDLAEKVRSA